jgi:hypothetical protein
MVFPWFSHGNRQESIEKATRQLARLRMVDEVNKMLDREAEKPWEKPWEKGDCIING